MVSENGNNMYMPVAPAYGNGGGVGFGNDWGWIILLLLFANGGMWGGFGGGMWGMDGIYPWMNQANLTSNGFQNQLLNDNITSIRDGVQGISTQLCNGFASIEQGANARQMADMQQMFGIQSSLQNCCCENRAGIADLKYTIASEECATRSANAQNTQAVLDKLCQLELDGYKREADQLRAENSTLKNQGFIANEINQQNEVFYNRLKNCPVNAVPVFGNQPIFTCGATNNGCGCQSFYN